MTTYGLTPQGFVVKPQSVILAEIEADQRAALGPLLDLDPDQPIGQLNGSHSRQLSLLWEGLQAVYASEDPDSAEDDALDNDCKLTGTGRDGASYALTTCTVNLGSGKTLVSGTHFAALTGDPSVRFTPKADYTAPSDGAHTGVVFRAENTGPVIAPSGTIAVIATPLVGWISVLNTSDAAGGQIAESDDALRIARESQLGASGNGNVEAIAAKVAKVAGVISVSWNENTSTVTDVNGLPAHSFEIIVYDLSADDDLIAQAIWDSKGSGIRPVGIGSSGSAVDGNGDHHTMPFTRVTQVPVYLTYDNTTGTGYVGDTALKEYIVAQAAKFFGQVGTDVDATHLIGVPYAQTGVLKVVSLKLGLTASPTLSADLPMSVRQLATFDTARVVLT